MSVVMCVTNLRLIVAVVEFNFVFNVSKHQMIYLLAIAMIVLKR